MKYGHLERIRVTLTTSAPVFIGSQNKLNSRECILNKGIIYVPDFTLLVNEISRRHCMEDFESFLVEPLTQQGFRQNLSGFLYSLQIPIYDNAPWILYKIRTGGEFVKLNGLNLCLRNAQGRPYIPGSSIKGAFRTALLAARIPNTDLSYVMDNMMRKPKNDEVGQEEHSLRTLNIVDEQGKRIDKNNAITDLLKGLHVSDSAPFEKDSTIVCKKMELQADGELRGENGKRPASPVYRECLQPGLKTHFYITLDRNVVGQTLTVESLTKALRAWYGLQRQYINQFDLFDYDLKALPDPGIPLILGGGVGFQQHSLIYRAADQDKVRKTVHYVLKEQFTRRGRCSYKPKDINKDPAPYLLKLVKYGNRYYPMGHCRLALED